MAMATSSPLCAHASSALFYPSQSRPAITSLLSPQPRYSKMCELRGLTAVVAHSRKHTLKTIREGEICQGFVRRDAKGSIEHQRNAAVLNATENEGDVSDQTEDSPQEPIIAARPKLVKKKAKISAKPIDEQKLTLRFLWLEKNIGIGLDLQVPGHGTIPLSPFYFWPKKDAWEEIKAKLESKSWISQRRMIILLNQVTDIINLWQQKATSA